MRTTCSACLLVVPVIACPDGMEDTCSIVHLAPHDCVKPEIRIAELEGLVHAREGELNEAHGALVQCGEARQGEALGDAIARIAAGRSEGHVSRAVAAEEREKKAHAYVRDLIASHSAALGAIADDMIRVEKERDAAVNARDHLKEIWDESCGHVKEALELLHVDVSVDGFVPDTWTLLEQCEKAGRALSRREPHALVVGDKGYLEAAETILGPTCSPEEAKRRREKAKSDLAEMARPKGRAASAVAGPAYASDRSRINREHWAHLFAEQPYIEDWEDRTNFLLDTLEQKGVRVVDLEKALAVSGDDLKTANHWRARWCNEHTACAKQSVETWTKWKAAEAERDEALSALRAISVTGCMQSKDEAEFFCKHDGSAHSVYCSKGIADRALRAVQPDSDTQVDRRQLLLLLQVYKARFEAIRGAIASLHSEVDLNALALAAMEGPETESAVTVANLDEEPHVLVVGDRGYLGVAEDPPRSRLLAGGGQPAAIRDHAEVMRPEAPFSQTTAEAHFERERARLGYYPGHEATCTERDVEFTLSKCACGPKSPEVLAAEQCVVETASAWADAWVDITGSNVVDPLLAAVDALRRARSGK